MSWVELSWVKLSYVIMSWCKQDVVFLLLGSGGGGGWVEESRLKVNSAKVEFDVEGELGKNKLEQQEY